MPSFYTYDNLKTLCANVTGRTDGSTANVLRDNFINYVIRDIVDTYPFSWTRKLDSTITLSAAGQADLPADYNPIHGVKDLRQTVTGDTNDHVYTEVPIDRLDATTAEEYAFALDYNTSTSRYRLNTKQTDTPTLTVIYNYFPADLSAGSDPTIVPDPQAIGYMVGARLWLAKERDETNHDRYWKIGQERVNLMITKDRVNDPTPPRTSILDVANFGFNSANPSVASDYGSK